MGLFLSNCTSISSTHTHKHTYTRTHTSRMQKHVLPHSDKLSLSLPSSHNSDLLFFFLYSTSVTSTLKSASFPLGDTSAYVSIRQHTLAYVSICKVFWIYNLQWFRRYILIVTFDQSFLRVLSTLLSIVFITRSDFFFSLANVQPDD